MVPKSYRLPLKVAITVTLLLAMVQVMVDTPMLLAERFLPGAGWVEIVFVAAYAAFVTMKMQDRSMQPVWRVRIWTIFTIVFFGQLLLGLSGYSIFLMTGELHLPLPFMIVSGPVYRAELSFMTILFVTTIIISGPAWCSQLCYFGAIDARAASKTSPGRKRRLKLLPYKMTGLATVVLAALIMRFAGAGPLLTTSVAIGFGIAGLLVIFFLSRQQGKMMHCIAYCPIGTIVHYTKFINPFRFRIDNTCTSCMKCIPVCRYNALDAERIRMKGPGITCTLCGDCMSACKPGSFHYTFPGLDRVAAGNLYLGITITLHAVFLALARI
jgi:polyferredoxin